MFSEQRLGDAVHRLDVTGDLPERSAPELDRHLRAAIERGVRWLIVDLSAAREVADGPLGALLSAGRDLQQRQSELVLAGAPPAVRQRIAAAGLAHQPVLVASSAEALMILKMAGSGARPARTPRAAQKLPALYLPRLEPPG